MKVNYMAPEAIAPYCMDPGSDSRPGDRDGEGDDHEGMSMRLGRASDIWSLGCILYQMIYGRPPFAALTTIQKLRAIPDDKYVIQYPQESEFSVDWDAVGTIQACLQRDPRKRALIKGENGLLSMPFLLIDAMQHSRIRNKDKNENYHENRGQDKQQDRIDDNCISVSKDKV
jgi:serine/threonine protein kinase